jgi:hypothetical protein
VRTRPPPHNAFTDTAADREFLTDRNRQKNRLWGPLRFSAQPPRGSEQAERVEIGWLPWPYSVRFDWDAEQDRYLRTMDGLPHLDGQTGERIAPTSVVVQFANVQPIPNDEKLRLDVDLVNASGDLLVFSNGTQRNGSWAKSGPRSSTRWLDESGDLLVLPHGQVWVALVPLGSPLSVS